MTIRAMLDRRVRRLMGLIYAGIGLFLAGILIKTGRLTAAPWG